MFKPFSVVLVFGILAMYCSIGFADSKPLVEDLSWMTGSWVGPAGPNTLEENWTEPVGASIASLVRMTGDGSTSMVEMIIIEEENDSLVLRIQQWNPGYIPRTPTPQTMELVSIEENRVKFRSTGEAGMATLMYSRPTPETFNIDIETAAGASFQLNLKAR